MFLSWKTTALLLAGLVLAAQGNDAVQQKLAKELLGSEDQIISDQEFELEARQPAPVVQKNADWNPEGKQTGLSANVNSYVDSTLYLILPFLRENGLDPMPLPEIVEGFRVRYLLITYSAWLKIHEGSMTGLTNVERSGDQMVHYFARMLRVRVVLNFKDLLFNYRYLVTVMNIGPRGGIEATLDRYVVVVDVLIDFNNDEVHLQEFSINEIGRLRVRFTLTVLLDWLINPVLNVFVRIFDTIIIKVVESNIHSAVNQVLDVINANVRNVVDYVESFN
ncbi:group 7 allergen domain-containing protein [Phthorimaea operculella]|nr:group 7 allergen domain-containing protein [Phthorimaea operculella]